MIAIDQSGNIITNNKGMIKSVSGDEAKEQNFASEVRCVQGTFDYLPSFGRNPAVWYLTTSISDRVFDLVRISKKYLSLKSIDYINKIFNIRF